MGLYINGKEQLKRTLGDFDTDDYNSDTVVGRLESNEDHIHKPSKVYPSNAAGVNVAGGAGAWQHGNKVEIIPANTITDVFDIHYVIVEDVSANDVYQIQLYTGSAGSEVLYGTTKTTESTILGNGQASVPIRTSKTAANTRISASVASSSGNDNIDISLEYHEY